MPNEILDFSFDMAGVNRQAILHEASSQIDAGRSHLSGGAGIPLATPEGNFIRDLMQDQATLAAAPDVYQITDEAFLDTHRPVPVRFQELSKQFKFYWVRISVGLMPRRNWAFDRLEVKVIFNPNGAPNTRPKAYQILPDKKYQDLLNVSDRLEVTIDEKFELSAKAAANVGVAKAEASAALGGEAGFKLSAGPFEYRIVKAKIDHSGTGMEWVFWRLDGAEFFQENRPELVVIAQVPKTATEFRISAAMQAYRYFNFASTNLQDAIRALPGAIASFFKEGAPVSDYKPYELTDKL